MDPRHNGRQPRVQQLQQSERQHQRFSWQTLPPNEDAPAYEPPQQPLPQIPRQPQVNTNVNAHGRAFSYAQTPIEHRDPYYATANAPPLPQQQLSPSTPIDPRPQSICSPHGQHPRHPQPHIQPVHFIPQTQTDEKAVLSPVSPQEQTLPFVFQGSPPRQPAPIEVQQPTSHARKLSNLSPINTNLSQQKMPPVPPIPDSHRHEADPLPQKAPITPISPDPIHKSPMDRFADRSNRKSYAAEPYSPHGFETKPTHAVFSPHAAHGPNGLDFALHQPGQIAHPNMEMNDSKSHEWKHSLCGCSGDIGTCITGLFCPCILYGRTSYRLSQKSDKKDPTDMLGYSTTNGHCMLMGVACGLQWLFPMFQRTRIRHAYKLPGNIASDLLKGCCCCCCVAIQNEREVKDREESSRRWAGPASTDVYTAPSQMLYTPQRLQMAL
jgi:Cys-rich protein (TIGR01571 family)